MSRTLWAASLSSFAWLVSGCTPPSAKEVAAKTSTEVRALLREAWETGEQTNGWSSVDQLFATTGVSADRRPKLAPVSSIDSSLDSGSDWLQRVFTDENVVSSGGGALVFQVRGADVCAGSSGQSPDPSCVDQVDRLQLKVKAWGDLDLALQVGPDSIEPFTLHVRTGKSVGVETDLAQAQKAAQFFQTTLSTNGSNAFQGTVEGRVQLRLEKNGDHDFTLTQAVLADVRAQVSGTDGVQRTVKLAAKNPTMSLRVEGPARRATLVLDVGELDVTGLYGDFFGSPVTSPVELLLSGLSGTVVLEEGKAQALRHLGLGNGKSIFRYKGQDLVTVEFNRSLGRSVDLAWTSDATSLEVTANPGLELQVTSLLERLEPDIGTDVVAREWRNISYDVSLMGATPTVNVRYATDTQPVQVKLVSGTLGLSSNDPALAPRSFTGPVCLQATSSTVSNHVIESFETTSCN